MSETPRLYSHAIGVFDSGVGGLSVLRAVRAALPHEDLVYVADSGHAPYGDKSLQHITQRTLHVGQWLALNGVDAITIACNTATVVAAQALREQTHLPVVAIEPAIKPAVALTQSGAIGVLATQQTVQSSSVARLIAQHAQGVAVHLQACAGWVEQVEAGALDDVQTEALVRAHVTPLLEKGCDTLVLGCTHYPFLTPLLRRVAGPGVTLLDPAQAVARELVRRLGPRPARSTRGQTWFLSSGNLSQAQRVIGQLWGQAVAVAPLPE